MPDFLTLPRGDRGDILNKGAYELGMAPVVLEKDVWVCWALKCLFEMPERPKMAFKGGTSLSKVYNAIHRFSEDVDVTVDYRAWGGSLDSIESLQALSRTKRDRHTEELREKVREYTRGIVTPHFARQLETATEEKPAVELDDSGEKLRILYEPLFEDKTGYVAGGVMIEFGGRNITEPNDSHDIRPYLASLGGGFTLPTATVDVLSPKRTFWEKATLIHVTCQEGFAKSPERQSRHWYDLYMLLQQDIGREALKDTDLLRNVLDHKGIFYRSGSANYQACLNGGFCLVPQGDWRTALRGDYDEMRSSGMFWSTPPGFAEILEALSAVQQEINEGCA